jgi:hypothetical protein
MSGTESATERCECHCRRGGLGRAIWGLGLVGVGVALTLDNLGVLDAGEILRWWPVLLVLLGANCLLAWRPKEVDR